MTRSVCLLPCLLVLFAATLGLDRAADAQPIDTADQRCIHTLNKDLRKLAQTQGKEAASCLRDFGKDKLGAMSASECLLADRKGKVAKARGKTLVDEAKRCGDVPPPSARPMPPSPRSPRWSISWIWSRTFSGPVDDAVALGDSQDLQKCQQSVWKRVQKCADSRLNEFVKCKLVGMRLGLVADGGALQDACPRYRHGSPAGPQREDRPHVRSFGRRHRCAPVGAGREVRECRHRPDGGLSGMRPRECGRPPQAVSTLPSLAGSACS